MHDGTAMRFPKFSKTGWIVLAGVTLVLAAVVFPPVVAVWDGHFRLTIAIEGVERIERDSLAFATFWREAEAEEAVTHPGSYEWEFRQPEFTVDGQALIRVPASGRAGGWMTDGTYKHPQHLVVTFRSSGGNDDQLARKRFAIPAGRGPRSMRITLP